MTTLFHFASPVKSSSFGRGLLASRPSYRADHTAADEAWLAADNARRDAESRHYDRLAGEAAALARHEAGIAC